MARGPANGSPERFWNALKGVWLSPRRFFGNLNPDGGLVWPAVFASLIIYLDLILEAALQAVWNREFEFSLLYGLFPGLIVAVFLALLLVAGFTTLILVVLDGAPSRAKFGPVFRPVSYATAILIVLPIPYGPFLALIYGPYVAARAIKETLDITWKRAAAATLIPLAAALLILLALLGPAEAYEILANPPQS